MGFSYVLSFGMQHAEQWYPCVFIWWTMCLVTIFGHRNSLTENLDFNQISWINSNVSPSKIDSSLPLCLENIYTDLGSFTRDFAYHASIKGQIKIELGMCGVAKLPHRIISESHLTSIAAKRWCVTRSVVLFGKIKIIHQKSILWWSGLNNNPERQSCHRQRFSRIYTWRSFAKMIRGNPSSDQSGHLF